MREKLTKIWMEILKFFNETKVGHQIKSFVVTFTALFLGALFANEQLNELFKLNLPTIQQLKDVVPVIIDTFYRSLWAFILLQVGIYKYNSSSVENDKPVIVPIK